MASDVPAFFKVANKDMTHFLLFTKFIATKNALMLLEIAKDLSDRMIKDTSFYLSSDPNMNKRNIDDMIAKLMHVAPQFCIRKVSKVFVDEPSIPEGPRTNLVIWMRFVCSVLAILPPISCEMPTPEFCLVHSSK